MTGKHGQGVVTADRLLGAVVVLLAAVVSWVLVDYAERIESVEEWQKEWPLKGELRRDVIQDNRLSASEKSLDAVSRRVHEIDNDLDDAKRDILDLQIRANQNSPRR